MTTKGAKDAKETTAEIRESVERAGRQHPTSNIAPSEAGKDGGAVSLRSAQHPTSKEWD